MVYTTAITLDVYENRLVEVYAVQGDTARAVEVTVTQKGVQLIPAKGTPVSFRARKPDKHGIDNPATITEKNTIYYKFTEQTTACPGRFPAEISFTQTDGQLTTVAFWLVVTPSSTGDDGESTYEYGTMVEATQEARQAAAAAQGAAGDASDAADAANAAAGKANTAASDADAAKEAAQGAADAANTAAGKANDAAKSATDAASTANTAAQGADDASAAAQAATTAANGAADKANTAAQGADKAAQGANTAADAANAAAGRVDDAISEADAATDEALDAAEQARQAAQSVIEQIDGVIVENLDTGEKNIARFRVKDGHPAILEAEL